LVARIGRRRGDEVIHEPTKEKPMTRIRRILHPSDFSRASAAAFTKAVEMAKANRAELLIVHVRALIMPAVGDGYIAPNVYEEIESRSRAAAQKQLDALVAKAKKAGVRAKGLLLEGVPHVAITRAARARRADLIVLGTHGRTGLARFFVGSVASRVVSTATCPVLTVRGK
jgi:nucleotide-binding universal stress UspA family protein